MEIKDIVDLLNNRVSFDDERGNVEFFIGQDDRIVMDSYINEDKDFLALKENITSVLKEINEEPYFIKPESYQKHEKILMLKRDLSKHNIRENPPTEEGLGLFKKASSALFELEQFLRRDEKANVNKPMFRMRIGLSEIEDEYRKYKNICEYVTLYELVRGTK